MLPSEITARIGLWTLEDEEVANELLQLALNRNNVAESIILVTLDMSKPWELVNSLTKWLRLIRNHLTTLFADMTVEEVDDLKNKRMERGDGHSVIC